MLQSEMHNEHYSNRLVQYHARVQMWIADVLKYYVELFLWFLVLCCATALAFFDFHPPRTLTSPLFRKFSIASALWTLSLLSHSLHFPAILFWPFTCLFCLLSFIYTSSEILPFCLYKTASALEGTEQHQSVKRRRNSTWNDCTVCVCVCCGSDCLHMVLVVTLV
jgi:hypothetical protein